MAKKQYPSKTTQPITLRLKNEQIEVIDHIVELGGYENRTDAIRAMLYPQLVQCVVAMQTKSIIKAAAARIKAEKEFQERVTTMARNSEIQDELDLHLPTVNPVLEMGASPI